MSQLALQQYLVPGVDVSIMLYLKRRLWHCLSKRKWSGKGKEKEKGVGEVIAIPDDQMDTN